MAQINTKKGKPKKQHEGFLFIFDKLIAEGEQKAWRCEAKNGCKARIWTDLQDNVLQPKSGIPIHSHDANPANVISQRGMTAIKRRAEETMEPPAMLRAAIMENVPSPALYAMPNKKAIKDSKLPNETLILQFIVNWYLFYLFYSSDFPQL
jgi:hypothetical protein